MKFVVKKSFRLVEKVYRPDETVEIKDKGVYTALLKDGFIEKPKSASESNQGANSKKETNKPAEQDKETSTTDKPKNGAAKPKNNTK